MLKQLGREYKTADSRQSFGQTCSALRCNSAHEETLHFTDFDTKYKSSSKFATSSSSFDSSRSTKLEYVTSAMLHLKLILYA